MDVAQRVTVHRIVADADAQRAENGVALAGVRRARAALRRPAEFDRLLIAQALVEPLRLVTADAVLAMYSDLVVVV